MGDSKPGPSRAKECTESAVVRLLDRKWGVTLRAEDSVHHKLQEFQREGKESQLEGIASQI